MKIVVLAGGLSTERDVSILSGSKVAEALRSKGHQVVLMDVFMGYEGDDFDAERLFKENYSFTDNAVIDTEAPDLDEVKKSRKNQTNVYFGDHVLELCRAADITFLGLHGGEGEDGSMSASVHMPWRGRIPPWKSSFRPSAAAPLHCGTAAFGGVACCVCNCTRSRRNIDCS